MRIADFRAVPSHSRSSSVRLALFAALALAGIVLCGAAPALANESHQGLGPEATVPPWAMNQSIHFVPRHREATAGTVSPDVAPAGAPPNRKGVGCEKEKKEGGCEKYYEPFVERYDTGPHGEGGEVQHEPTLYVIYWGKEWLTEKVEYGSTLHEYLVNTFGAVEAGYGTDATYQGILHQYHDDSGQISTKVNIAHEYVDTKVNAPTNVNQGKILAEINEAITANKWPAPTHNDQYVVATAQGATFEEAFAKEVGCGYHGVVNQTEEQQKGEEKPGEAVFDFIPYSGASQFNKNGFTCVENAPANHTQQQWVEDSREETDATAMHEYAEGATDPSYKKIRAWENHEEYEIADICQGNGGAVKLGPIVGAWFELLWGNQEAHERGTKEGCTVKDEPAPTSPAPTVTTEPATDVSASEATLVGAVNPNGSDSHYHFEYGPTTSYGSSTTQSDSGFGETIVAASARIAGLTAGTTYHYRIVASSWAGTSYGTDHTLTTSVEYALPAGSVPVGITNGPDKNLWFTDNSSSKIGKITTSGTITEYALPSGSEPADIAAGPDGNLWFTENGSSKIGKITTSGTVTQYSLPAGSRPDGITAGSDGNLWFTEIATAKVGKITTSGTITQYALPSGSAPRGIAAGPDNNLWFTESGSAKIGKITTSGTITEYALVSGSDPNEITTGPDQNLWFTEHIADRVGKITTSGAITEYKPATKGNLNGIASGPDGNLWFTVEALTESFNGLSQVDRITTSGAITECTLPNFSYPHGIVAGPDSKMWFVDGTSKIASITP